MQINTGPAGHKSWQKTCSSLKDGERCGTIISMVQDPRQTMAATIAYMGTQSWALKAVLVVIPSPLLLVLTAPFGTRNGNYHTVCRGIRKILQCTAVISAFRLTQQQHKLKIQFSHETAELVLLRCRSPHIHERRKKPEGVRINGGKTTT